ncbi:hypothetical protein GGF50DRAFT_121647 [Schizophyllum commune]
MRNPVPTYPYLVGPTATDDRGDFDGPRQGQHITLQVTLYKLYTMFSSPPSFVDVGAMYKGVTTLFEYP